MLVGWVGCAVMCSIGLVFFGFNDCTVSSTGVFSDDNIIDSNSSCDIVTLLDFLFFLDLPPTNVTPTLPFLFCKNASCGFTSWGLALNVKI